MTLKNILIWKQKFNMNFNLRISLENGNNIKIWYHTQHYGENVLFQTELAWI
jgi:hypothetical protein